jgi:hypothetical protein
MELRPQTRCAPPMDIRRSLRMCGSAPKRVAVLAHWSPVA